MFDTANVTLKAQITSAEIFFLIHSSSELIERDSCLGDCSQILKLSVY